MNNFKILKKDKKTKARLGVLNTPHGTVKTPSYVFVGTYGKFRSLNSADIKKTKTSIIIANTFHLWDKALKSKAKEGFIHKSFGLKIPIMTDSGGFQVLSLAFGNQNKVGKFLSDNAKKTKDYVRKNIRITDKGVYFKYVDKKLFLGPKLSMQLQSKIGADIMFAFDHITGPLDSHSYNKQALINTDKWAEICLEEHAKLQKNRKNKQMLYGIVQGGIFKDLRVKSAKSIGAMDFDGFGIGGSYTKKQITEILRWIIPYLPEEKPRHLLGVGKIADVFEAVENGIDTFDCVIPTREARHGRLYTKSGHMDIRRGYYTDDKKVIERGCKCPTCSAGISRSMIREQLRGEAAARQNGKGVSPSQVFQGQRWCLMHNMWFFNKLLEDIRDSIVKGKLDKLKAKFLKHYK